MSPPAGDSAGRQPFPFPYWSPDTSGPAGSRPVNTQAQAPSASLDPANLSEPTVAQLAQMANQQAQDQLTLSQSQTPTAAQPGQQTTPQGQDSVSFSNPQAPQTETQQSQNTPATAATTPGTSGQTPEASTQQQAPASQASSKSDSELQQIIDALNAEGQQASQAHNNPNPQAPGNTQAQASDDTQPQAQPFQQASPQALTPTPLIPTPVIPTQGKPSTSLTPVKPATPGTYNRFDAKAQQQQQPKENRNWLPVLGGVGATAAVGGLIWYFTRNGQSVRNTVDNATQPITTATAREAHDLAATLKTWIKGSDAKISDSIKQDYMKLRTDLPSLEESKLIQVCDALGFDATTRSAMVNAAQVQQQLQSYLASYGTLANSAEKQAVSAAAEQVSKYQQALLAHGMRRQATHADVVSRTFDHLVRQSGERSEHVGQSAMDVTGALLNARELGGVWPNDYDTFKQLAFKLFRQMHPNEVPHGVRGAYTKFIQAQRLGTVSHEELAQLDLDFMKSISDGISTSAHRQASLQRAEAANDIIRQQWADLVAGLQPPPVQRLFSRLRGVAPGPTYRITP
ncbi:MAG: hypothetical protein VKJ04_03515 [Vampirovibrionales bacterium]|nr:hypothetical protein [Vampirovibrionales bacterium]